MLSRTKLFFACVLFASAFASALPLTAAPLPGWKRFDLPETGSYLWRYLPAGVDLSKPAPAVVFLHGSGNTPDRYRPYVTDAADQAGLIVILPKSATNLGWGVEADYRIAEESLRTVQAELTLDTRRVSVGGHSAGGTWAYLLAYQTRSGYSAVFSMAARFYQVGTLADPSYRIPIRMYWGDQDPNVSSSPALKQQWDRLGVPWEEEVLPGIGHNTFPPGAMVNGFLFVAGKSRPADTGGGGGGGGGGCASSPTVLCLGGGRFRVEVAWKDFQGGAGPGSVVPGAVSEDSGLFWFFAPSNWELLVKVLDGCAVNGHHWVFAAATTTVEYTLTVTDTQTDQVWTWRNTPGLASPSVTDTAALGGCG
jgi:predicted esterase